MWFEQAFPGEQHCVTRQKQLPGGQRELRIERFFEFNFSFVGHSYSIRQGKSPALYTQ